MGLSWSLDFVITQMMQVILNLHLEKTSPISIFREILFKNTLYQLRFLYQKQVSECDVRADSGAGLKPHGSLWEAVIMTYFLIYAEWLIDFFFHEDWKSTEVLHKKKKIYFLYLIFTETPFYSIRANVLKWGLAACYMTPVVTQNKYVWKGEGLICAPLKANEP